MAPPCRLHNLVAHVAPAAKSAVETPAMEQDGILGTGVIGGLPAHVPSDRYEQQSAAGEVETAIDVIGGRLEQDPVTGEVLASEIERLHSAERAAAEAADYLLAAELKRLRDVLAPRPRVSPLDCAPRTPEEQIEFFLRNGVRRTNSPSARIPPHEYHQHHNDVRAVGHL